MIILSARFANPDNSCAIIQTEEAGAVAVSPADTPELWAQMIASVTPSPFPPRPPLTRDQQIEALLAPYKVHRLVVSLTVKRFEDEAKAYVEANPAYTVEQVLAAYYGNNKTYKVCRDLETAVQAIEGAT